METYAESQIELLTSKAKFAETMAETLTTFHSHCEEVDDQVNWHCSILCCKRPRPVLNSISNSELANRELKKVTFLKLRT
jgi:gamma-glutamylcysteine synthetase